MSASSSVAPVSKAASTARCVASGRGGVPANVASSTGPQRPRGGTAGRVLRRTPSRSMVWGMVSNLR
jgi:hypothetical protein